MAAADCWFFETIPTVAPSNVEAKGRAGGAEQDHRCEADEIYPLKPADQTEYDGHQQAGHYHNPAYAQHVLIRFYAGHNQKTQAFTLTILRDKARGRGQNRHAGEYAREHRDKHGIGDVGAGLCDHLGKDKRHKGKNYKLNQNHAVFEYVPQLFRENSHYAPHSNSTPVILIKTDSKSGAVFTAPCRSHCMAAFFIKAG